jgi:hypothetical protein
MRDQLAAALAAGDGEARHELLEQLLYTVEAVRDFDRNNDHDTLAWLVEEAMRTVDTIQRIAGNDADRDAADEVELMERLVAERRAVQGKHEPKAW